MPLYAIKATGPLASDPRRASAWTLYGGKPRAYRELESALMRMRELKEARRDPAQLDYELIQVPVTLAPWYRPIG